MTYSCFAVTAPGLAELTRIELRQLGLEGETDFQESRDKSDAGGVSFNASITDLYRVNLHLRTASRIVVRLGCFHAENFKQLLAETSRFPWDQYLQKGQKVQFSVTCHRSRLFHTGAVAREVAKAIGLRLHGDVSIKEHKPDEDSAGQLILVRLINDECTVSVDSSGALLHKRGYRLQTAKAPLRETLAAGMLMASGWNAAQPLLDPFCGSGTIPIEAALMSANIPPGSKRRFAFMDWPHFSQEKWFSLVNTTGDQQPRQLSLITASDRDAGAIAISRANAERAGVDKLIQFQQMAVSNIQSGSAPGWVISNPPYGVRVSSGRDLRDLYARLGDILRDRFTGWGYAFLCPEPVLFGQTKLPVDKQHHWVNGGIAVKLYIGRL